jgi:hypothetical protein
LEPLPSHGYDTLPKNFDQLADWLLDGIDVNLLEEIVGLPLDKSGADVRVGKGT